MTHKITYLLVSLRLYRIFLKIKMGFLSSLHPKTIMMISLPNSFLLSWMSNKRGDQPDLLLKRLKVRTRKMSLRVGEVRPLALLVV